MTEELKIGLRDGDVTVTIEADDEEAERRIYDKMEDAALGNVVTQLSSTLAEDQEEEDG